MGDPPFRTDLYLGTAPEYDRFRLPYPAELLDDLRSRSGRAGGGRLLDLACGTGQIAFPLRAHFDTVVAVDQEPGTVVFGRAKAEMLGCTDIEWQVGAAEAVDLTGPFDLVVTGNAFHRMQRQLVAARALSWLRPGGCLALLWGGSPTDGVAEWQQALRALMADWLPRTGVERLPAGWEDAMARHPHEEVLHQAGLRYEGRYEFATQHVWTAESLLGFLYSTSILSRRALGDLATSLEADLMARMLACRPDGRFEQVVPFSYELARKPG